MSSTNGQLQEARTVAQVLVGAGPDGWVPPGVLALNPVNAQSAWYKKVRLMRRDPTFGLLRDVYAAALLGSEWNVELDHEEFKDAEKCIKDSIIPLRIQFLRDALRGFLDFGWQPYEVVKQIDEQTGLFYVSKLKGLLQDLTTILVDYSGNLVGLRNSAIHNVLNPNPVYLYRGDFACLYRDAEGTNWYSEPLMRRCERPYDSWLECDDGARRFDVKVAGAHWVVYYPIGTSVQRDPITGQSIGEIDNALIAANILKALQSSGMVAVPSSVLSQVENLNDFSPQNAAWRVELISAQTQQAQFVDRLKYMDVLKARGLGFPERAIQEGQFGTKAEAEAHGDFVVDNLEMTHREILALLNSQVVDMLLELNFGPRYVGRVRVAATPLVDEKRASLKALYEKHWGNEAGQAQEQANVDWADIREKLGVPVLKGQQQNGQQQTGQGVMRAGLSRKQRYLMSKKSPAQAT